MDPEVEIVMRFGVNLSDPVLRDTGIQRDSVITQIYLGASICQEDEVEVYSPFSTVNS